MRVTIVMTVDAHDVADASAIAWDAFTGAAADDLNGWDVTAAVAEVQPGPPPPETPGSGRAIRSAGPVLQVITSRSLPRVRGMSDRIVVVQVTLADHHDRSRQSTSPSVTWACRSSTPSKDREAPVSLTVSTFILLAGAAVTFVRPDRLR